MVGSFGEPGIAGRLVAEDGFARYSEARYIESAAGAGGLQEAVKDMSVGALAYDTVPLSSAGKLDMFSPEFQSLVTDKGAMILHMLRWVVGDQKFDQTMRDFAAKYAGKSATIGRFPKHGREKLRRQADVVLLAMAGFNRRAGVQDQVHGLSSGQQQGIPHRRADHAGPGSVPHAGGVEDRYRR